MSVVVVMTMMITMMMTVVLKMMCVCVHGCGQLWFVSQVFWLIEVSFCALMYGKSVCSDLCRDCFSTRKAGIVAAAVIPTAFAVHVTIMCEATSPTGALKVLDVWLVTLIMSSKGNPVIIVLVMSSCCGILPSQ